MRTKDQSMKARITIFVLAAVCCLLVNCAKAVGFGDILGTAWTIGDVIIGQTTITPAYRVSYWDYRAKVKNTRESGYGHWNVTRDVVLGQYFYKYSMTATIDGQSGSTNSHEPFPVDFIGRWNYQRSAALKTGWGTAAYVLDYKTTIWLESVVRTGLWPDRGPWTVWLKTTGTPFRFNWGSSQIENESARNYWGSVSLAESGHQTLAIGSPTCTLEYPFALGGDFY
jgi:hypothetical protein